MTWREIAGDYFSLYGKLVNILVQNTGPISLKYLDSLTVDEERYLDDTTPDTSISAKDKEFAERAMRSSLQRRWARTMLRLKSADIESYQSPLPWQPILRRAREKLDQQIGQEGIADIQRFIEASGRRNAWYRLHRVLRTLASLTTCKWSSSAIILRA